jgi:hypothetical protein
MEKVSTAGFSMVSAEAAQGGGVWLNRLDGYGVAKSGIDGGAWNFSRILDFLPPV